MNVKKLIEKLSRLDPDANVWIEDDENFGMLISLYVDDDGDIILCSHANDPDITV